MKQIIIIMLLNIFMFNDAWSQTTHCEVKGQKFMTKLVPDLGLMYYIEDSNKKTIDTLLVSQIGSNIKKCEFIDTLVTFYIDDPGSPFLQCFHLIRDKWEFVFPIFLPPPFPLIGMLQHEKKYERYRHDLISPNRVRSELTILIADNVNQQLRPLEKYVVTFDVNISQERAVILDKVLQKE